MATLKEVLQLGREQLQHLGETSSLEAELLLAHTLNKPRSHLFTWPEETISDEILQEYAALVHARQEGQPIAYLTGEREFWSINLKVSRATLIPRPETELLVEQALKLIPEDATWDVLDLGTGSGAIALALAKDRQQIHMTATDISPDSLKIAKENAKQLGVKVNFILSDWFNALSPQQFDLIVSNPPYIASQDPHLKRGDVRFEPQQALVAGEDGLAAYRTILISAAQYLKNHGWLLLEHGFEQADEIHNLLKINNFQSISTFKDFAGNNRLTIAQNISY